MTTDRRNDPELGKMGPDCIDHRGLLADEQMAGAVQHQTALLLGEAQKRPYSNVASKTSTSSRIGSGIVVPSGRSASERLSVGTMMSLNA